METNWCSVNQFFFLSVLVFIPERDDLDSWQKRICPARLYRLTDRALALRLQPHGWCWLGVINPRRVLPTRGKYVLSAGSTLPLHTFPMWIAWDINGIIWVLPLWGSMGWYTTRKLHSSLVGPVWLKLVSQDEKEEGVGILEFEGMDSILCQCQVLKTAMLISYHFYYDNAG